MEAHLTTVGKYPGIGRVVTEHQGADDFLTLEKFHQNPILTSMRKVREEIRDLLRLHDGGEILADWNTARIHRAEIEALERKGIIVELFNKEHPYGTYAMDRFAFEETDLMHGFGEFNKSKKSDYFRVLSLRKYFDEGFKKFTIQSIPPTKISKEEIENAKFENIPTSAQVLALCKRNEQGHWQWSKSYVLPDGLHARAPLTAGNQYGQAGYEGLIAMVNENREIVVFRPDDNARRMQETCQALCIPPVNEDQFVQSVIHAVLANKNYLPKPGSKAKLYIRPYVEGLNGGYGVSPADMYLFCIEVFPFSDYLVNRESVIDMIVIEGKARSHEGGYGAVKQAGNYAQTINDRLLAKAGQLTGYEELKFQDVCYFGDNTRAEIDWEGNRAKVTVKVLDEASSGNMIFARVENGEICLFTPPLDRKAILAGNTRDSVLKLGEYSGYKVIQQELTWDEITRMEGAFLTGSAAGMVRIGSLTNINGTKMFDCAPEAFSDRSIATQVFFRLYDLLYKARKGELKRIEDLGIGKWAKVIGKV